MLKGSFWKRAWHMVRWPIVVILILYIGLVIYRIPAVREKQKTQETVAYIHAQKLTMDDVDGKHLPPPPDSAQKDATVKGVDANANGIRDDVELAIFKKYPNSARVRAAELQYAMALQMELSSVFNSETLVAVMQEEGRGFSCVYTNASTDIVFSVRKKEVRDFVFNTNTRREKSDDIFAKYMVSFSTLQGEGCDINVPLLSN